MVPIKRRTDTNLTVDEQMVAIFISLWRGLYIQNRVTLTVRFASKKEKRNTLW